ncbi:right-handed parallel beta-helix repeat-containing protein [candidate division WOR-3 bacterium]|nr:right-handed parallel beta-helix repeat-containing protein [candidate division WOR-3 bacterium]
MKKSIYLTILFGIILYNHLDATIWYVYPESYTDGDNSGTNPINAFQGFVSINGNAIQPGDTLILLADKGNFTNEVMSIGYKSGTAGNPILITNNNTGTPIIDSGYVLLQNASYITFDNITIQQSPYSAINMGDSVSNIVIKNCILTTSGQGIGIASSTGDNNLIENCIITNNEYNGIGIDSNACSPGNETRIRNCIISDNGYHGIELNGNYYIIEENIVERNGNSIIGTSGIHVFAWPYSNRGLHNIIRYNFCNDNIEIADTTGFGPDGNGIQLDQHTGFNQIYYNICLDNDGAGIIVLDSRSNEIYNNSLASNYEDSAGGHVGLKFLAELAVMSLLTDSNCHSKDNIIKNNFVYAEDSVLAVGIDNESIIASGNAFSNNLYWNKDNNDVWQWSATTGNDESTWNSISSASDFIEDPNWAVSNPEQAEDFKLSDYSALLQRGVTVGLIRDYEGNPVLNPPSIGAYEYEFAVEEVHDRAALPKRYSLSQNYPNPFTQKTIIEFRVQSSELKDLQLQIYDLVGRLVKSFPIHDSQFAIHKVTWDGKNNLGESVNSGIYFYKLKVGDEFSQIKKLLLLSSRRIVG